MNMRFTPAPKMDQVLTAVLSDPGISWLKRQEFQSALRSLEKWSGQNLKNIPATALISGISTTGLSRPYSGSG
ncbi:hypothetical protein, partial [Mesorhizobium sp.]|uniref:hypothetical protein n=1 Tax=Mesorhizobium sp. TaxID=1871066 RepID=UPI00257EC04D